MSDPSPESVRLACLSMAVATDAPDALARARAFANFVFGVEDGPRGKPALAFPPAARRLAAR